MVITTDEEAVERVKEEYVNGGLTESEFEQRLERALNGDLTVDEDSNFIAFEGLEMSK